MFEKAYKMASTQFEAFYTQSVTLLIFCACVKMSNTVRTKHMWRPEHTLRANRDEQLVMAKTYHQRDLILFGQFEHASHNLLKTITSLKNDNTTMNVAKM